MTDFNSYHFGFIGLGLIGGSIARSIRENWPKARITAFNPSRDSLVEAFSDGVVSDGHSMENVENGHMFNSDAFEDCDIVFLCAPVQKNADNLAELKGHLKENAILTDIGSTKRNIHQSICAAGFQKQFIGGHPMTGSERTRYRNSRASLLENAYYIITPEPEVCAAQVQTFRELVEGMHALPLIIDNDFHDYAVAGVSHVPHVVAAALVNLVKNNDNDDVMKQIAAGGFKDITRIASSSPVMWQQICMTNGDKIVSLLDRYIDSLKEIRESIAQSSKDSIYDFFDSARFYRDSVDDIHSGAMNLTHLLFVDIEDRPGYIAEVVTILGVNNISIKNINITHNREYQEGAMRLEFYSAKAVEKAKELLISRNYSVH